MTDWSMKLLQMAPIASAHVSRGSGWRLAMTRAPPYGSPEQEANPMEPLYQEVRDPADLIEAAE